MELDKITEALSKEIVSALEEIQKTDVLDQKVQLSTVIRNLSEALNVHSSIPCGGFQLMDVNEDDEMEINSLLDEKLD